MSLVGHRDIAEVVVAVLRERSGRFDGVRLPVTGPEAVSLAEAAERMASVSGSVRRFEAVSARESRRLRSVAGEPPHSAEGWVSWFAAVESGEVAEVSSVVPDLTGHPAQALEKVLATHPPR